MKFHIVFATAVLASIASPLAAQAQGVPGGIAHGVDEGNRRAGPVGAVVGGAVGGVIGGVEAVFGIEPAYRAAPAPEPRVYHHRRHVSRSYRHTRRRHTTG